MLPETVMLPETEHKEKVKRQTCLQQLYEQFCHSRKEPWKVVGTISWYSSFVRRIIENFGIELFAGREPQRRRGEARPFSFRRDCSSLHALTPILIVIAPPTLFEPAQTCCK